MTRWMLILTGSMLAMIAGCQSSEKPSAGRQVTPTDFVAAAPRDATATDAGDQAAVDGDGEAATDTTAAPVDSRPVIGSAPADGAVNRVDPAAPAGEVVFVPNGMVGQANGRPIFAMDVFEPVHDILVQKGRELPRVVFRQEVTGLIDARLEEIIFEALIIGEAERHLAPQEKVGLRHMLDEHAAELIRRWGEGSRKKADARLQELFDQNLDQRVDRYRQQLIIRRYIEMKVGPKLNITRKDVERYYHSHPDEFRPKAKRVIHMIVVDNEADRQRVDKALSDGTPFKDVARTPYNRNRPDQAGLYGEVEATAGGFAPEALDQAVRTLAVGQHSEAIAVGSGFRWVYIDSETGGEHRALRDVQLEIRERLQQQQYKLHTDRLRLQMLTEGSYTDLNQMRMALIEVAMSRYARPE